MHAVRVLLTTVFLCTLCSGTSAQQVFLQREGKFLYPPNLSTGGARRLVNGYVGH